VKNGYDVTIIAQHTENEIVDGIKIIALPEPKNRFERMFFLTFKSLIRALKERANVYHLHDPELILIGILLKLSMKAKVIYDVHEDIPRSILSKHWLPEYLRKFIADMVNIIEKLSAEIFDVIITATPSIGERFARKKTIIVVRNLAILSVIEKANPIKFNKEKPVIIYAGGIAKTRGIKEMIKAAFHLNGKVELWLLGLFSPESFKEEILSDLKKDYIKYIGYLPFEKMYSFMKSADIGLAIFLPEPNHIAALPNKLFEYMAVGLPIVASDFPLWKEIIEGNNCGLTVNPLNAKEIAKVVEYLIEHPEEAKKMGENGRKAVLEKYNWEKESEKLINLYKELLR